MEKALRLFIIYIIFLISGIIFASLFYSFYLCVINFVAGQSGSNYSMQTVITAFFKIFPIIFIFICPLLCYYRTRHIGNIWQLISFILISLASWILFFPLSIKAQNYYFSKYDKPLVSKTLTNNYFRKLDNKVYYFTDDFTPDSIFDRPAQTIIIDTDENGEIEETTLSPSEDFILYQKAEPYNDILIKDTFSSSGTSFILDFSVILNNANTAWSKGLTYIIGFLTLAFALCSLFAWTNIFDWKLLNTTLLTFLTAAILFVNTYYYHPIFDVFKHRFISNNKFFNFLGNFVDDPFLCLINLITGIIIILSYVIKQIIRKKNIEN